MLTKEFIATIRGYQATLRRQADQGFQASLAAGLAREMANNLEVLLGEVDNPELDGTDAAHPAWWRGHEVSVYTLCQKVMDILNGKDDGSGAASDPWETVRRRLIAVCATQQSKNAKQTKN